MGVKRTLSNTTNYVQSFINSAYDDVKAVYDNLADILLVANSIDDVNIVASAGDLSVLSTNIAAFLVTPTASLKNPCIVATTANITLSNSQTVDGVAVTNPDRVAVKDQTDPIENGIYTVVDAGAWIRTTDWDGSIVGDVIEGTVIPVTQGTGNQPSWWMVTTTGAITVGTTAVTIERATTIVTAAVTLANEAADTTCYPVFATIDTGDQQLKTAVGTFTYNAATGQLGFTSAVATGDIAAATFTSTGAITVGGVLKEAKGTALDDTDITAAILSTGSSGNTFDLSGSETIDQIASHGIGTIIRLVHTSVRTLTHNATNLVLPGNANIATAIGDISEWFEYATGDWKCINYQRDAVAPLNLAELKLLLYATQVSGHIRAGNTQLWDGEVATTQFLVATNIVEDTFESVGPTGSGADNIWADMDNLPASATILLVDMDMYAESTATTFGTATVNVTHGDDATPAFDNGTQVFRHTMDGDAVDQARALTVRLMIPLGATNQDFKIGYALTNLDTENIKLHYRGFITD